MIFGLTTSISDATLAYFVIYGILIIRSDHSINVLKYSSIFVLRVKQLALRVKHLTLRVKHLTLRVKH